LHLIIFTDDLSQIDKEKIPTLLKALKHTVGYSCGRSTPQGGPIKLLTGQVFEKKWHENVIPTAPYHPI